MKRVLHTVFGLALVAGSFLLLYAGVELPGWVVALTLVTGGFFVSKSLMIQMFKSIGEAAKEIIPAIKSKFN